MRETTQSQLVKDAEKSGLDAWKLQVSPFMGQGLPEESGKLSDLLCDASNILAREVFRAQDLANTAPSSMSPSAYNAVCLNVDGLSCRESILAARVNGFLSRTFSVRSLHRFLLLVLYISFAALIAHNPVLGLAFILPVGLTWHSIASRLRGRDADEARTLLLLMEISLHRALRVRDRITFTFDQYRVKSPDEIAPQVPENTENLN